MAQSVNIGTGIGMMCTSNNNVFINGERVNSESNTNQSIGRIVETPLPPTETTHLINHTPSTQSNTYSMGNTRPYIESVTVKEGETRHFDFRDPSQPNIGIVKGEAGTTMTFNF